MRNTPDQSQSAHEALKAFDATSGKITILDQNDAVPGNNGYAYDDYDGVTVLADNTIVFAKVWYNVSYPVQVSLPIQSTTIESIQANGQDKKTLLSLAPYSVNYPGVTVVGPDAAYYTFQGQDFNNGNSIYEYDNGSVQSVTAVPPSDADISGSYYLSPSGNTTLWSAAVNGQTVIYVGDQSGNDKQSVAQLDNTYQLDGWYGNNYILVTKNNNTLYIMPVSGVSHESQLAKITSYYGQGYYGQ
jgi:hypothetical protein